jgi:cytochrome c oxidase subunit 1
MFAGFYFWWPKMTGKLLDERLGKIHFWLLFVGFHTTFLVQHWLGVEGMPRRYADYSPNDGFTTLNQVSTVGAFLLASSMIPFLLNVYRTARSPEVTVDDPWGWGRSLEWATSCPPPRHNFESIPRIRSESPAFDLHHPEVAALEFEDNEGLIGHDAERHVDASEQEGREAHLREQGASTPTLQRAAEAPDPDSQAEHEAREHTAGMPKRLQIALFVLAGVALYLAIILGIGIAGGHH